MDNSLAKLLECIEPKITNIQETRVEIKSLSEVCKTITEIVELGRKSYLEILDYYDQEFIIRCIKLRGQDVKSMLTKYNTSKYLLQNQDAEVENLPQYKESLLFMDELYAYLKDLRVKILAEYEVKASNLKQQELLNKYYILLQKDNVFIANVSEFFELLDYLKPDLLDRLNILIYVNRCNIKNYNKKEDVDNIFISNVNLTDIKTLLEKNQDLITDLDELVEVREPILMLGKPNKEVIEQKKRYLINKMHRLFEAFEYEDAAKCYKEYTTLIDYDTEFKKQNESFTLPNDRKLIFMMDQDKSLLREYLENSKPEYQGPVLKNLLDIEQERDLLLPYYYYEDIYLYVKPEFIVKTVYTFLDDGQVLVLGAFDKRTSNLLKFLSDNKDLIEKNLSKKQNLKFNKEERELILKNIKIEDLVLTINLNMLDVKMEDENAR